MAWTGELAVVTDAGIAAWGGRILNEHDLSVWQGAERWSTSDRASAAGLQTLQDVARAHRIRLAAIRTPSPPHRDSDSLLVPGAVPEAERLARAVLPLAVVQWERLTPTTAVAHGHAEYQLDLAHQTCTCPAWRFGRRPCKHLVAALR